MFVATCLSNYNLIVSDVFSYNLVVSDIVFS